jgi:hypothetical protein
MAVSAAIWATKRIIFNGEVNAVQNIILSLGRDALRAVIGRIDQLHKLVAEDNLIESLYTDPDIPSILSDLCNQQGVAETILFNDHRSPGRKESDLAFAVRKERVTYVQTKCAGLQLPILKDRELRNSLTHIDGRLPDELAANNIGWLIDVAVEKRGVLEGVIANQLDPHGLSPSGLTARYCRSYIASEDIILHFDHEVSLSGLREEINLVLGSLFGEPPRPIPQLTRVAPLTKAMPFKASRS